MHMYSTDKSYEIEDYLICSKAFLLGEFFAIFSFFCLLLTISAIKKKYYT